MGKDRIDVCKYYICAGSCSKGREADHAHYNNLAESPLL